MNLTILLCFYLNIRCYKLVTLSMDVDDFDAWIILQVLAQLGDINIHRTRIEVVVVNPDGLQGEVTLQNLIGVRTKQSEKVALLGCQFD